MDSLKLSNPVFVSYLFYSSILVMKILLMPLLTARFRFAKKIFISPEDTVGLIKGKNKYDDPDIERVRRAHLNDLENILPFFIAGLIYTLTSPSVWFATTLFRIFTISRIIHTLVYAVVVIPQPARAIAWGVGFIIQWYMMIKAVCYFA